MNRRVALTNCPSRKTRRSDLPFHGNSDSIALDADAIAANIRGPLITRRTRRAACFPRPPPARADRRDRIETFDRSNIDTVYRGGFRAWKVFPRCRFVFPRSVRRFLSGPASHFLNASPRIRRKQELHSGATDLLGITGRA